MHYALHNIPIYSNTLLLAINHERRSFLSARFCVLVELLVNFGHNINHKCMEKRISCTFHLQHHWIQQGYLYQTKAKVICVYFLRTESVVKLVFEVKSALDFLSAYIYDYLCGPSSSITENLAKARMTSFHGLLPLMYIALVALLYRLWKDWHWCCAASRLPTGLE